MSADDGLRNRLLRERGYLEEKLFFLMSDPNPTPRAASALRELRAKLAGINARIRRLDKERKSKGE